MTKKILNQSDLLYTKYVNTDCPIMLINGDIGDGPGEINGQRFADELYSLDESGVGCVKIYINSMGGSVSDGMSIFDAILNTRMKVVTYCSGMCHSIAAIIWLAGDERYMTDYGSLMFHNPFNVDGSEDKGLDIIRKCLLVMVERRSEFDEDVVEALMNMETWMMADQAESMGLSDDTIQTPNKVKKAIAPTSAVNKWKLSNLYLNKFIENDEMKKNIKNAYPNGVPVTKETATTDPITPNVDPKSRKVENPAKPDMLDSSSDVEECETELEEAKQALIDAQADQLEDDEDVDDCSGPMMDCAATGNGGEDIATPTKLDPSGVVAKKDKTKAMDDDSDDEVMDSTGEELDPAEIMTNSSKEIADLRKEVKDLSDLIRKITAGTEPITPVKATDKKMLVENDFEDRAKKMVDSYIRSGKIKDASREKYMNLARKDYANTKAILEDMTTVVSHAAITVDRTKQSLKPKSYIDEVLAKANLKAKNKQEAYKNRKTVN